MYKRDTPVIKKQNMPTFEEATQRFLAQKVIAVAGVSSTNKDAANYIFEKLKQTGYEAYAINPNATEIEGEKCYANLASTPKLPDAVVIAANPAASLSISRECAELGINHVWMHKSVDNGSYSAEAEEFCRDAGINLIPAGCPMMHLKPVDFPHKCIKWVLRTMGRLPKTV
jgi:predicted CoA-binding protein